MEDDREFYTLHLPYLLSYVVPVLQYKKGDVELGSGVLVKAGERHFVATSQHCIDADVRVVRGIAPFQRGGTTGTQELRILDRGWHDTLDLGYLEIADPACPQLDWNQLSDDRIVGGMVQVVGYPKTLAIPVERIPGKLTDISLCTGTFGTTLTAEADDRLTFNYPKVGMKYDERTGSWYESQFPKTPKGFSGGAIFGVEKTQGAISHVQYKLLGIQYEWNMIDSIFAIPITKWKELLVEKGLYQQG